MSAAHNYLKIVITNLQTLNSTEFFMFLTQEPTGTPHSFYFIQS